MKKIYKVAGIVAFFIFLTVLTVGISKGTPITTVIELVGEGVIDRTVEVRNGERGQGLAYSSDMRTPSLDWYGKSQVNIFETLELQEGNEKHISVSSVYDLENIYHFTDAKNYRGGSRYKISHTGSGEGQNNFYVSDNLSYMTVTKKVNGSGRWCIMRKNATGCIYKDKGDYSGNFTIRFEDNRKERLEKGTEITEDWLVCP